MDSKSDKELIRQTLGGQLFAFEVLVRRYQKILFAYTRRMLKSHDAAEDATQEAFIRAFESLKNFDHRREFKPWLYQIATNYCKDFFRKENRLQKIQLDIPTNEKSHIETVIQGEQNSLVQKAIMRLPELYRFPLVKFYFFDLSCNELAKLLEIPVNSLKTRLRRGRMLLRKELVNVYQSY